MDPEAHEQVVVPVKPLIQEVQLDVEEQVLHPVIKVEQGTQVATPLGSSTYPVLHGQLFGIPPIIDLKSLALHV